MAIDAPWTAAGILSHYLLENPWPAAALGLLAGAILGWHALREGHRTALRVALACIATAFAVPVLALSVTTNAERGAAVVADLVRRAEAGDVSGMLALMTPGCLLHYGRPENPGTPRPDWEPTVGLLQGRYAIERNSVTRLDAESASGSAATVELACLTEVGIAPYPTPSVWWMRVAEQPDGAWRIERIACLKVGREAPTRGTF